MFRRVQADGCACTNAAAHPDSHDCTHADLSTHCDAYRCICTVAGACRHVLARADGNPATHGYSYVCAYVHTRTNPDCCGARG
ncbi:MAG: hypothetical protein F4X54_00255 [Chloroflexi bacterium]|nr:hypothetical protein [Chloroflexota bacterium]